MLHNEFVLLKITDIVKEGVINFVYDLFSNRLPPIFYVYFETLASFSNRNTRQHSILIKNPKHATSLAGYSNKIHGDKV